MNQSEQNDWITLHIPHRVRAAIARLNMQQSVLQVTATIDPKQLQNDVDKTYWRCATDSLWEGRLTATRWLIEFVGIKQGGNGNPTVYAGSRNEDVTIAKFGANAISPLT